MANTLTISISAQYSGNGLSASNNVNNQVVNIISGNAPQGLSVATVPTTPAAIPLGAVAAPRYLFVQNNDLTNYMTVETGTGGTNFSRLLPGDAMLIPLDPSITAPFWSAHSAPVSAAYRVFET